MKNKTHINSSRWLKVLIFLFLAFLFGCGDTPACLSTETNLVKIAFVDEAGIARQTTFSLRALDYENLFVEYTDTTLSKFEIPLNPASDNTILKIDHDGTSDTLGLTYHVVQKLISPECGLEIGLSDLDTTFSTFENLQIIERIIFEDVTTNIEITL